MHARGAWLLLGRTAESRGAFTVRAFAACRLGWGGGGCSARAELAIDKRDDVLHARAVRHVPGGDAGVPHWSGRLRGTRLSARRDRGARLSVLRLESRSHQGSLSSVFSRRRAGSNFCRIATRSMRSTRKAEFWPPNPRRFFGVSSQPSAKEGRHSSSSRALNGRSLRAALEGRSGLNPCLAMTWR